MRRRGITCPAVAPGQSRQALLGQAGLVASTAIGAGLLSRALGLGGLAPMLRPAGAMGTAMHPGMALQMAVLMALVGVLIPRPACLAAWFGLARLGLWVIGLTLFALIDAAAVMAAMGTPDTVTAAALAAAPLFIGLLLTIIVPSGERCCIGFMLIMAHFSLMSWPWLALCAVLGRLGDDGLCQLAAPPGRSASHASDRMTRALRRRAD